MSKQVKIGDYIVYRQDVCKVTDLVSKYRDDKDFYRLEPEGCNGLVIYAPVDCPADCLRPIITRSETTELIKKIPNIEPVDVQDNQLEATYKELVRSGNHEDLVKVIKTTYLRNDQKAKKGQKKSENDKTYFRLAEKNLYSELSVVLGMSVDETRDYVIGKVNAITV